MTDLPDPVDEKLRGVVAQYDPVRREGVVKLPAPHGRLHFFLNCLLGSLKEQVVADSKELNRLRKWSRCGAPPEADCTSEECTRSRRATQPGYRSPSCGAK